MILDITYSYIAVYLLESFNNENNDLVIIDDFETRNCIFEICKSTIIDRYWRTIFLALVIVRPIERPCWFYDKTIGQDSGDLIENSLK